MDLVVLKVDTHLAGDHWNDCACCFFSLSCINKHPWDYTLHKANILAGNKESLFIHYWRYNSPIRRTRTTTTTVTTTSTVTVIIEHKRNEHTWCNTHHKKLNSFYENDRYQGCWLCTNRHTCTYGVINITGSSIFITNSFIYLSYMDICIYLAYFIVQNLSSFKNLQVNLTFN